jgi:hypothetical protein
MRISRLAPVWFSAILLALGALGCGAAPTGASNAPSAAELVPLEIGEPSSQLAAMDQTHAVLEVRVMVRNPNAAPVTMRQVTGQLSLDGVNAANISVTDGESFDPESERAFVIRIRLPLTVLLAVHADQYVARGEVRADSGSGDGALVTPFEWTGPVPEME